MSAPLATGVAGRGQRMAHLLIKVAQHRASVLLSQWVSGHPDSSSGLTGGDDMISRRRAAAHQRMLQLDYQGSDEQLAAALTDAWLWRSDSTLAAETLANLIESFHDESGLILDPDTGTVTVDPAVDPGWAEWTSERVSAFNRGISARKFADNTLAGVPAERRSEIDQQLHRWTMSFSRSADHTERLRLDAIRHDIDAAMQRAEVPPATREIVQFGLTYLSGWQPETFDLRSSPTLLDPSPQSTAEPGARRAEAGVAARNIGPTADTTPTETVSAEGSAAPPGRDVDRDQVRSMLRDYADAAATMAAYADRVAADPDLPLGEHIIDIDDLLARMDHHRRDLSSIADNSAGLHSLERDMIRCLVHEIDHGDFALPDLLLIDQHSKHLADQQQHDRIGRDTLEVAEHRLIAALDAAGTGVRELTNTDAEPIRSSWERVSIHLSALAHRWTVDIDTARTECTTLANEFGRRLTHGGVPGEARTDILRTLHDTIDFAYHHAHDGIERDEYWATPASGHGPDLPRGIGTHQSPGNSGRSRTSPSLAAGTTDLLAALPAMPHASWASPAASPESAAAPPPGPQAGPTL
ncbi:hypothetical protein IU450_37950 [Nocardia abscessus]|uniref:hypothetical protein n=1 Tax=Nocardia abscessus TaxID=120957 RepID=UPI001893762B|nr:hypothetical protein [Nocardia abscessus]MBF6341620.1 hypothetical protein [Nocardia abscessus]